MSVKQAERAMAQFSYAELQAMRSQAFDEARRFAITSVDLDAVEREIARRDPAFRA